MTHADWMARLPERLRSRPLSQIAIPGSHDSGTSDISTNSPNGPDLEDALKRFEKYACCIAKKFIVNYAVTQNISLTLQMREGVRYLDLRLAFEDNDFFFTHGLLSTRFSEALEEIRSFVRDHAGEVLLLDFNHFYGMRAEHHAAACAMIVKFLAAFLYPMPFGQVTIPSVKQCVDTGKRILVFYQSNSVPKDMPFWSGKYMPSPWANVNSVAKLMDFLEKNYDNGRPEESFYVTQAIVTPDKGLIIKHPMSTLRSISDRVNPRFVSWVSGKEIGAQGINICIVDFIQDFEVVPTVLALNK